MAVTLATWTAPPTWTANLAFNVTRSNNLFGTGPAGLGGNMQYLLDYVNLCFSGRPVISFLYPGSFAYTSTTFVTVNTTTARMSLTTSHASAKVLISGGVQGVSGGNTINHFWDILIDGTIYASGGTSSGNGLAWVQYSSAAVFISAAFSVVVSIASAGLHTFDLVVRSNSASGGTVLYSACSALEVA